MDRDGLAELRAAGEHGLALVRDDAERDRQHQDADEKEHLTDRDPRRGADSVEEWLERLRKLEFIGLFGRRGNVPGSAGSFLKVRPVHCDLFGCPFDYVVEALVVLRLGEGGRVGGELVQDRQRIDHLPRGHRRQEAAEQRARAMRR